MVRSCSGQVCGLEIQVVEGIVAFELTDQCVERRFDLVGSRVKGWLGGDHFDRLIGANRYRFAGHCPGCDCKPSQTAAERPAR